MTSPTIDPVTAEPVVNQPAERRGRLKLIVASGLIAVGLVIIGYGGFTAVTNNGTERLPDEIESITPVDEAIQVPQQTQVVVDLKAGYTGRLVIDDQELTTHDLADSQSADPQPGQQISAPAGVVYEVGNATLTFTPSANAELEHFSPGNHIVEVVYWKLSDGPSQASTFRWTFHVV